MATIGGGYFFNITYLSCGCVLTALTIKSSPGTRYGLMLFTSMMVTHPLSSRFPDQCVPPKSYDDDGHTRIARRQIAPLERCMAKVDFKSVAKN